MNELSLVKQNQCPFCESNHVSEMRRDAEVEYNGSKGFFVDHYSICQSCGTEFISGKQAEKNHHAAKLVLLELMGGMTPVRIKAFREKYDLTQAKAAAIFGGGARAFSKYERGDVTPSDAMERLLYVADQLPMVTVILAKRENVALPRTFFYYIQCVFHVMNTYKTTIDLRHSLAKKSKDQPIECIKKLALPAIKVREYAEIHFSAPHMKDKVTI